MKLSACISIVCTDTVSIYILDTKVLGIYRAYMYESMHTTQVLDMYLNIQVLGTYMLGTCIQLSLKVCTVSIKL